MPINTIDSVAIKSYEQAFLTEFQAQIGSQLKGLMREDTSVRGKEKIWSILGGLTADPYGAPQSEVQGKTFEGSQIITTFQPYTCDVFISKFQAMETLADLMSQIPAALASAAGTRSDQIRLDAMAAHTTAGQVLTTNEILNVDAIRNAARLLDRAGVPGQNRYMVAHVDRKFDLMSQDQTINNQFINAYSLVDGQLPELMGFKLCFIATGEGMPGISTDTTNNKQHVYFFHHDAIGYSSQVNPSVGMEMANQKKSVYSWVDFSAGCSVLQDRGLVTLEVDTVAPAAP